MPRAKIFKLTRKVSYNAKSVAGKCQEIYKRTNIVKSKSHSWCKNYPEIEPQTQSKSHYRSREGGASGSKNPKVSFLRLSSASHAKIVPRRCAVLINAFQNKRRVFSKRINFSPGSRACQACQRGARNKSLIL